MNFSPARPLRDIARHIVRLLQEAGFEALWVGGCVRDELLDRTPGDYDIATNARPDQIEKLFRRTIPVGRKFGVMLVVEEGHQFQVATFRAESDYTDGRRPGRVSFGDARADALRRDFTINGLFFDPVAERLCDWVGGESDLKARLVRTIGEPEERFAEDHLRLLRAVRFAAQLDFEIEARTFEALRRRAADIAVISAERIRDELIKLFRPPHAARGLVLLRDSGLLQILLPEIAATIHCEQSPEFHPEGTVFEHICLMLREMPADAPFALPWTVLLHDVGKPPTFERDPASGAIHFYGHERVGAEMADQILRRLRFSRKQIDEIVQCVRYHMQFKDAPQMRKATLRRMLMRPTFPLEFELHRLDCVGSHGMLDVHEFLGNAAQELARQPEIVPPLLTGRDLMKLGVAPGPRMGALLAELREKQLQDELKTQEEAREWIKGRLRETAQKTERGEGGTEQRE